MEQRGSKNNYLIVSQEKLRISFINYVLAIVSKRNKSKMTRLNLMMFFL
jgi:hypothetical protein